MASLVSGRANPYPVPHEPAPGSSRALDVGLTLSGQVVLRAGTTVWLAGHRRYDPPGCPEGKGHGTHLSLSFMHAACAFLWPRADVPFWDRRSSPRTSRSPSLLPSYGLKPSAFGSPAAAITRHPRLPLTLIITIVGRIQMQTLSKGDWSAAPILNTPSKFWETGGCMRAETK